MPSSSSLPQVMSVGSERLILYRNNNYYNNCKNWQIVTLITIIALIVIKYIIYVIIIIIVEMCCVNCYFIPLDTAAFINS